MSEPTFKSHGYTFTGETRTFFDRKIHRVCYPDEARQGGWIEKTWNLDASHGARVWDEATVCDRARVRNSATVGQYARVQDSAHVMDSACVSKFAVVEDRAIVSHCAVVTDGARVEDRARIGGSAHITKHCVINHRMTVVAGAWVRAPLYVLGSRYPLTQSGPDQITIGCETNDIDHWLRYGHTVGVRHGYTPEQIVEYLEYVQLIAHRVGVSEGDES